MPTININPHALRDHALPAATAETLATSQARLQAGQAALVKAKADRAAAYDAHRSAILGAPPGAANTANSAETHQRACGAVDLAESILVDLEAEVAKAQAYHAEAIAKSWNPVQVRGRELRLAAARAGDQALAAIAEAKELFEQGTALINAGYAGGIARPATPLQGLILDMPGRPPRLPTAAEELAISGGAI